MFGDIRAAQPSLSNPSPVHSQTRAPERTTPYHKVCGRGTSNRQIDERRRPQPPVSPHHGVARARRSRCLMPNLGPSVLLLEELKDLLPDRREVGGEDLVTGAGNGDECPSCSEIGERLCR